MFNRKITFDNNEVNKNELSAGIMSGEVTCKLSNLKDLNLAATFEKSIFNKELLPKSKGMMGIKANAVLEANDEGNTEPPNSDPNQAYPINMDVMYTDSITGKGKRRWYHFQLTEKKKVTAYMSPIADVSVDNDLDLYKLDLTNGTLSVVAQSQNPAATYELLSYVAEPGYYFLSVAAFAGEVANQFSFMVRLSDTWDENEADDSLLQAKAQPLNKTVIHTLDNTIDQDISILNVSTSGSYTFALYGLPDNLNYLLQIMNTNMEVLATIPQNSTSLINLPVNSYIIRVLSSDGNIDASVTYKLMVEELPKDVDFNITGNSYTAKLLNDGSHFISVITTKKDNACKIFVDGTFLDYNSIDFETHRVETKSSTSECSITTTKDTTLTRADICSYIGSNENRAKNLKHAISMCLNNVVYGETHSLLSYNAADVSTARNVIKGTDQYNKVYYKGFWRNVDTKYDVWVVWNLDTLEVVDFSHPNWFHGSPSIANYKPYGMPENITITSLTPLVE